MMIRGFFTTFLMKHSLGRFGLGNASLGFGLFISQFLLNQRAKVLIFTLLFVSLHPTLQIIKMEYRKIGDNYYIRMDRGEEIISNLLEICEKESIPSAVFSGIGGCQSAELQVFIPETGSFETEQLEGMLELVSLNGNVVRDDDGKLFHHTHALFSFKKDGQHGMAGGHLKATTVLYTAEIELRPTIGGAIGRKFDPETGTGFWDFK